MSNYSFKEHFFYSALLFTVSESVYNYPAAGQSLNPNPNLHPSPGPLELPGDDGERSDGAGGL